MAGRKGASRGCCWEMASTGVREWRLRHSARQRCSDWPAPVSPTTIREQPRNSALARSA